MLEIVDLIQTTKQETLEEALARLGWFEIENNHDVNGKYFAYRTKESVIPEELFLLPEQITYSWDTNYPKWLPFYIPVRTEDLKKTELDFPGICILPEGSNLFAHPIGARTDFYSSEFMLVCMQLLILVSTLTNLFTAIIIMFLATTKIIKKNYLFCTLEDMTIKNILKSF